MKSLTDVNASVIRGVDAIRYAEEAQLGIIDPDFAGNREVIVPIEDANRNPLAALALDRTIHRIFSE